MKGNATTINPLCRPGPEYCDRTMQITIGSFLSIVSVSVLCLTLAVIYAHFKSGNLSKNGSAIFVLSTWHLVSSSMILIIIGFYFGPTIIFQTIWPDHFGIVSLSYRFNHHIAQILQAFIFSGSMFNIVIALNRVFNIQRGLSQKIFSRTTYNTIALVIFPSAFLLSYIPAYIMPCCKMTYSYTIYSVYGYTIGKYDDYAFLYVSRPFYIIATIIPVTCYAYVFGYAYWMKRQVTTVREGSRTELIRSLLFAMIFFFYMCSWLYYDMILVDEIFDVYLPLDILTTVFILLEAGMNSILQAFMIPSVRHMLQELVCYKRQPNVTIVCNLTPKVQVKITNF